MAGKAGARPSVTTKAGWQEWVMIIAAAVTIGGVVFAGGYHFGYEKGVTVQEEKDAGKVTSLTNERDDLNVKLLQALRSHEPVRPSPPSLNVSVAGSRPLNETPPRCGVISQGVLRLCASGMSWGGDGVTITLGDIDQQGSERAMLQITDEDGAHVPLGYAAGQIIALRAASGDKRLFVKNVIASPPSVATTVPAGWR